MLEEWGTQVGDDVEMRVYDGSANIRYMVIPTQPPLDGRTLGGGAGQSRDQRQLDRGRQRTAIPSEAEVTARRFYGNS